MSISSAVITRKSRFNLAYPHEDTSRGTLTCSRLEKPLVNRPKNPKMKNLRAVNSHRCIQLLMFAFLAVIPVAGSKWPSRKELKDSKYVRVAVKSSNKKRNSENASHKNESWSWYTDGRLEKKGKHYDATYAYGYLGTRSCLTKRDYLSHGNAEVMTLDAYAEICKEYASSNDYKRYLTKKAEELHKRSVAEKKQGGTRQDFLDLDDEDQRKKEEAMSEIEKEKLTKEQKFKLIANKRNRRYEKLVAHKEMLKNQAPRPSKRVETIDHKKRRKEFHIPRTFNYDMDGLRRRLIQSTEQNEQD